MGVRKTIQIGDARLRQKAKPVPIKGIGSTGNKRAIRDLVDTMRKEGLVGIAGPQIALMKRIFVTEIRKTKYRKLETDKLRVFINPKIVWSSKKHVTIYEGCGSVNSGNLFGEVKRPEKVKVEYYDENGMKNKEKFDGLLARVIQHEYDHLDGVLFVDRVTDPKTYMDREHYLKMVKKK